MLTTLDKEGLVVDVNKRHTSSAWIARQAV
jgi:hypothetical protein